MDGIRMSMMRPPVDVISSDHSVDLTELLYSMSGSFINRIRVTIRQLLQRRSKEGLKGGRD